MSQLFILRCRPAIVHRGPPLSSSKWAQMFVYAIREFETVYILLNNKVPFQDKCSLHWLTDGIEDVEYGKDPTNVFHFLSSGPEKPSVKMSIVTPWTRQNIPKIKTLRKKLKTFNRAISDTEYESSDYDDEDTVSSDDSDGGDEYNIPSNELQFLADDLKHPLVSNEARTNESTALQNRIMRRLNDEVFDTQDDVERTTTKRPVIADIPPTGGKIKRYQTDSDVDRQNIIIFTLNNDDDRKTINGVETFGLISNKILKTNARSGLNCGLCAENKTQMQNLKISETYVVGCCIKCAVNIYELLKSNQMTLSDLTDVLIKKIDQQYLPPILFKNGKLLDPLLPKMLSDKDVYRNTLNKLSPDYKIRL